MSAFAIFATVLTIGYIIYYGITISRDIIANKKAENSTVETFDVEEISAPVPTAVQETSEGFSIAPVNVEDPAVNPSYIDNEENHENEEVLPTPNKAKELVAQANAELQPMVEASEPGFTPEQLEDVISEQVRNAQLSLDNASSRSPRIACTVVDESHGQEMPNTNDDDEEEIRL